MSGLTTVNIKRATGKRRACERGKLQLGDRCDDTGHKCFLSEMKKAPAIARQGLYLRDGIY